MVDSRKGPRHAQHTEAAVSEREVSEAGSAEETEQLILTLHAATHEIVNIEKLARTGERHQLSEQDCAELTGEDEIDELLGPVQDAYEAGLAEGLGAEDDEDDADEDAVLWHFLRQRSIGRQLVRGGLRRSLLRRLLLRRLLRRRVVPTGTAQQQRRESTAQDTRNGSASV